MMHLSNLDLDKALEGANYEKYKETLLKLIEESNEYRPIPIVTHRDADGDALAASAGVAATIKLLAEHHGLESQVNIVTPGGVRDPQNKAMLTVSSMSVSESLSERHNKIILVDASRPDQSNVGLDNVGVAMAIDPGHTTEAEDNVLMIGGNARATCTITTLLYLKCKMELEDLSSPLDVEPDPIFATLAHFGVVQDTNDCSLSSSTELDDWVRRWGYTHQDPDAYMRIKMYPIPRSYRVIETHALNHTFDHGSLVVCCLGYIKEDYLSLVSKIADDRRREEQARKVVSIGIVEEEDEAPKIKVSIRDDLDTTDTVSDVRSIIGPQSGGGQGMAAGVAKLGYRGDLIRLASEDVEDAGPETKVLPLLFLDLLQKWRDKEEIPDIFQPLEDLLRKLRTEVEYGEEQECEIVLQWFRTHRSRWSQERKESDPEDGMEVPFPSQEEKLAELFREAEEENTGTPREVMEDLIFRQITRRARSVFGEEK